MLGGVVDVVVGWYFKIKMGVIFLHLSVRMGDGWLSMVS